jgi:putative acyl-CoA dehydrogenase
MSTVLTHEVTNQPPPLVDHDLWARNRPLRDALAHLLPGHDTTRLAALGVECGSAAMLEHARLANARPPQLRTHDRFGHRIDQVEFHPSYHALMASALRHGLHGAPWAAGAGAHLERAAGFMLFTECEPSVLCPVSMTYAVTPALRANPALAAAWLPRTVARDYDPRFLPLAHKRAVTLGMGMTEKQGGSDVRSNTTRAERDGSDDWGERYRITGHKWFMSAPMCDAHLVLAQAAGGLSCFLLPRLLPDGRVNALHIQRLKHKLGNHANASSEVEFHGALAWRVGDEGRGVPQILAMGALTRLDCALGSAGLMRAALTLALHHCAHRSAFGRRLLEQPLMKNVLADLALESEAATVLALRLAAAIDRSEQPGHPERAHEAALRRVLTPIAKFWVCKRGSHYGQEAMECLGGNGYVEEDGEGVMARIYRELPLNSIWEGAANIMALDLLRALRSADAAPALERELAAARGLHPACDRLAAALPARIDGAVDEIAARALARDVALLMQAALLARTAPTAVAEAWCRARLASASDVYGTLPADLPFDALIARAQGD